METRVYKGCNNPYGNSTCIVFSFDKIDTPLKKNIENTIAFIKGLYNNINTSYIISKSSVVVFTHFPHFWEVSKRDLGLLFQGKSSATIINRLKKHFKGTIGSASSICVLDAAIDQKIPITTYFLGPLHYHHFGYGKGSEYIINVSSSKDSKFSKTIQNDKTRTNELAEHLGFTVPQWFEVSTLSQLKKAFEALKDREMVLKPYDLTRGVGVYVGIRTFKDAVKKFHLIKALYRTKHRPAKYRKMILQERISGNDYRILCLNGKFAIATHRIPAYVIGNGKFTIKQLVETENQNPLRDKSKLFNTLKPIVIDNIMGEILAEQGFTLDSVPPKGLRVHVRKAASVSQGGFTRDVTNRIHPQICIQCEQIAQQVNAFTLGIDIICKHISRPLTSQNGGLIEINTAPEMYLNVYPAQGKQHSSFGKTYLFNLLGQNYKPIEIVNIESSKQKLSVSDMKRLSQRDLLVALLDYDQVTLIYNKEIIHTYQISSTELFYTGKAFDKIFTHKPIENPYYFSSIIRL